MALLALCGQGRSAGIWTGGGSDNSWSTAANWDTGVPANNGTVNVTFAGTTRLTPTVSVNWDLLGITFSNTAGAFVIGGNQLTIRGGGVVNNDANLQTINNAIVLGAAQTWNAAAGSLFFGGAVANGGNRLTLSGSSGITLAGSLTGTGGLTKTGTGSLALSGANLYSGATTLSAGTVLIGSDTALGTGVVSLNGATIGTSGGSHTLANDFTVDRTTTFSAADDLTLDGSVAINGNRTISVAGAGAVTVNGEFTQTSGKRKLTKTGTGTLALNGANTFGGGLVLTAGTLSLGNNAAMGTGTVSLGAGTVQATGTAGTFSNTISITGNTTFAGTNDLTFTGAATMTASRTLTVNNNAVTFSGVFAGNGFSLTKAGAGTLTLSGTSGNTFSGSTIVNAGTLVLAKNAGVNAIGGTVLTIGDGIGAVNSAVLQLGAANQIPNTANVTIALDGQLNLQSFGEAIGALTTTGGSVIGTGRLDLGGNVTASAAGTNVTTVSAPLGLNATRTFTINDNAAIDDADLTVSGVISNGSATSGLIKAGTGTLLLSGANTYTGTTEVNAGTIWLDNSTVGATGPLGAGAVTLGPSTGAATATLLFSTPSGRTLGNAITTRAGGTGALTLGGLNTTGINTFAGTITVNRDLTLTAATGGEVDFNGTISGAFAVTKTGGGIVKLNAANSFSGLTTVSDGTLLYGVDNVLANGAVTVSGGALDLGASHTDTVGAVILDNGGSILGNGTSTLSSTAAFDLRDGTVTARLGGSVGLNKTTAGIVMLSGANTYTGATGITAGTLQLGAANSIPAGSALSVSSGATFDLADFASTIGSFAGAGQVLLGSATLTAGGDNSSTTFSGIMSGTGGFTKAGSGTLTLSGANTHSGVTAITAGALRLGAANVIPDASAVTISTGATFDLNSFSDTIGSLAGAGTVALGSGTLTAGSDGTSTTFSGAIGGTGGLIKTGAGTMMLTGANGFTGAVSVDAGALTLQGAAGAAASASSFTIGSGATLTLDNSSGANTNRISNSAAINLGGGSFNFIATSSGLTETVGVLNAAGGASTVSISHLGLASESSSLTFSSLGAIGAGASVNFQAIGGTLGSGATGPHIYILGQANGFIGGWATVGSDFAEYYADGVRAFSTYYTGSNGINVNDATKIVLLNSNSTLTACTLTNLGTTTDLGLNVSDIATVDLGLLSTNTLNLASGGLIKSGSPATTISGAGRLTAGGTSAGSLSVSVDAGHTLTISSKIIDNAGANGLYGDGDDGIIALTKADAGLLILSGANTYRGSNTLNVGTVQISAENQLGDVTNDITFGGGTLRVTAGFTANAGKVFRVSADLSGTLDIDAGQTLTIGTASELFTTRNTVSTMIKKGAGTLELQSASTGFDGTLQVDAGVVELRNAQALGDAVNRGRVTLGGGTLRLANDASTSFANAVTVTSSSTIDVRRLSGTSPAVTHTLGALSIGAQTLTITGANGAALALGSVALSGAAAFNPTTADVSVGAISGGFGFTKIGAGKLTLTGAGSYTGGTAISVGTLQLGIANGVSAVSAVNVASGAIFDLQNFNDSIGSLAGAGSVPLGSGTLTVGNDNTSTSFSGAISGTGGLTKIGSGTLTLSGANSYTGATAINAGTLRLGAANVIADNSAVTVLAGATFNLNGNSESIGSLAGGGSVSLGSGTLTAGGDNLSTTFSGAISGTGGLTKNGTGTLTLSGASTFSGATNISAGVVLVQNAAALGTTAAGTTVASGAALQLASGVSVGAETLSLNGSGVSGSGALRALASSTWGGAISLAANATITADAGMLALGGAVALGSNTLTFSGAGSTDVAGAIGGSGGIAKSGAGVLILSGTNTFTGVASINTGIAQVQNAAAFGASGASSTTVVASGATIQFSNSSGITVASELLTLSGTGAGGIGAFNNVAGQNTWAGNVVLAGDATFAIDADSLTLAGGISESGGARALTKSGAGTLYFSGASTYTGATQITAGTLQITASDRLSDTSAVVISSGATLALDDFDETIGSLAGAGTVDLGDTSPGLATLTFGGNGASTTFSGTIMNNGDLVKEGAGTLALTGTNTQTGTVTINNGAIAINSASSLGASTNVVTINAGTLEATATFATMRSIVLEHASAAIMVDPAQTFTINTALTGTGGLRKTGTGTLVLGVANSFTGATTISAGALRANVAGALGTTSAITVDATGTLLLGGTGNRIADSASLTLAGGTFATGGTSETLGALTLNAESTIDLGAGASVLTFASATRTGGALTIVGWSGSISGGGTDQIRFTTAPNTTTLAAISFQGFGQGSAAIQFGGYYELVPVPEPSTIVAASALLGAVAYRERRRLWQLIFTKSAA